MPNWKKLVVSGSDASLRTLNVNGAITASGNIVPSADNVYSLGTSTNRFQLNGGTPVTVTGSGDQNYLARFNGNTEIQNSNILSTDTLTSIQHTNDGNQIFVVSGSNGELLSVTDEVGDELLRVNDTSGIGVFIVSSSGTINAERLTASTQDFVLTYNSGSGDIFFQSASIIQGNANWNTMDNIPDGIVSQSAQTIAHLLNQDIDLGTGDLTATDITSTNFTINDTLTAPTITGSLLRLSENGTGLRMTNIGAFDNSSGDFRIFANQDLIFSTNGQSGTALTLDRTTKDATFVGAISAGDITGSALQLNNLGSQNEILIVGANNAVSSSNILSIDSTNNYLGINQSNPEVTLHMTGEGAQTAQIRMEQHNNSGDAPDIRTRRTRGTADSPTAVNAGDFIYRQNHEYYTGTEYRTVGQLAVDVNSTNADRFQLTLAVSEDGTAVDAANNQFKIDGNDGGAITFNNSYKFPTSDGSANQVLQTDGSGTLSFETTFYKESISGASSYTITHNLGEDYPIVQVYDENRSQVLPGEVTTTDGNELTISFDNNFSGVVVVKK